MQLAGQERDHHRRRLRRRPNLGRAVRRGRRARAVRRHQHRRRPTETAQLIEEAGGIASAFAPTWRTRTRSIAVIAACVRAVRTPRHHVQQRRHPHAAPRHEVRGPHLRRLRAADRGELRWRVPRLQARRDPVQGARRRRRDPQHRLGRRPRRLGRHGVRRDQGRGAPAHQGHRGRVRARRHPGQRHLPRGDALHRLHGRWGHEGSRAAWTRSPQLPGPAIRWADRSPPRTAPKPPSTSAPTGQPTSPASSCPSTADTSPNERLDHPALDRDRIRELFDLRSNLDFNAGGTYTDDPYPVWHELRAQRPVHPGTVHG